MDGDAYVTLTRVVGAIQFEYDQYSRSHCVKNISYIEFKNALLYAYSGLPEYKKTFDSTWKRYKLDVRVSTACLLLGDPNS